MKVRIKKAWNSPKGNPYKVGATAEVEAFDAAYHEALDGTTQEVPKPKKKK